MNYKNWTKIDVFDTTLRDGQQCPWAWMTFEQNLEFAKKASDLGIDVLEAWFPAASDLDFKIVEAIAAQIAWETKMKIAWLCQLREDQVDKTSAALKPVIETNQARVHTYFPVDQNLLEASLWNKAFDKEKIKVNVFNLIKKSVDAGCETEFSL